MKEIPAEPLFYVWYATKTNLARHLYLTVNSVWRRRRRKNTSVKERKKTKVQSEMEHAETAAAGGGVCRGERACSCAGARAGSQVSRAWDPLKPLNTSNLDLERL